MTNKSSKPNQGKSNQTPDKDDVPAEENASPDVKTAAKISDGESDEAFTEWSFAFVGKRVD